MVQVSGFRIKVKGKRRKAKGQRPLIADFGFWIVEFKILKKRK
jgi:hypothetical protein